MGDFLDIDSFTKQSKIGNSSVYKVVEKETGKIYAAKVSKEDLIQKDDLKTISNLNHPSILKLVKYSPVDFDRKPNPVIITEYATNGSLSDVFKIEKSTQNSENSQFLNATKKLINIYGIASALCHLHKNKIVHQNLKISNILEDDYLFPKISDFFYTKNNFLNGSTEKKLWIPPESYKDKKYTKEGDVFAFAFIAYQILTLKEPFKNYSNQAYFDNVIVKGERPKFDGSIDDCYKKLLERCWSPKKEERPTFDEIVKELKTNENFVKNGVDKNEFFDYVKLIDGLETDKKFKKILIQQKNQASKVKPFEKLLRIDGFKNLSKKDQLFFQNTLNQELNKKVLISVNITNSLYENNILNSQEFFKVFENFEAVLFAVDSSSENFKQIYMILTEKMKKIKPIRINLISAYLSHLNAFLEERKLLVDITISPEVKIVSQNSFKGCSMALHVSIPGSLTSIKSNAFNECYSLEEIQLPESLTEIGEGAFFDCISLKKITIPTTIKTINDFTFQRCMKLVQITIPPSVTLIGDYAFDNCASLSEISVPASVNKIGDFAFRDCVSLKSVAFDLHGSLTSIGDFTFRNCSKLKTILIPPHVNSIGDYAFKGCSSLTDISISYSLSSIGVMAFDGCTSLIQIAVPYIKGGSSEGNPIIPKLTSPSSAVRKNIGISSDVKIVKSSNCTIF